MTCPVSGKIGYSTYSQASKASTAFHRRFSTTRAKSRTHAYHCAHCGLIHIGRRRK